MHSRELVEVAALVAAHGSVLVEGPARISASALEQYWTASKCRLDRWLRSMKRFVALSGEPATLAAVQAEIRPVVEEILVAEIALRVWTAVLYAYDRRRQSGDAEPIARSVFLGHLEVRQRVLALLIHSPYISAEQAVLLNRLRRRAERWTDLLLGYLSQDYPASELAFEPGRCQEFAADLRHEQRATAGGHAWRLVLASLRIAFQSGLSEQCPNADANREIAGSIMACFPSDLFDSTGLMHSLWLVRLSHATSDAQGLVDELLRDDSVAEAARDSGPASPALGGIARRRFL
jgi:hypothetical protein